MKDIFDEIEEADIGDVFESVDAEDSSIDNLKSHLNDVLLKFDDKERKKDREAIKKEFAETLKREIAKIKPIQNTIQNVIEKTIETRVVEPRYIEPKVIKAPPAPPQVIKEVRVEVQKPDQKQAQEIEDLKKKILELAAKLEESSKNQTPFNGMGFRTGKIIPSLSQQGGKYLTNDGSKLRWATVSAQGGGSSPDAYTVSNLTTVRTFDADSTSIDELADVLGSLIVSLQGAGIIQ